MKETRRFRWKWSGFVVRESVVLRARFDVVCRFGIVMLGISKAAVESAYCSAYPGQVRLCPFFSECSGDCELQILRFTLDPRYEVTVWNAVTLPSNWCYRIGMPATNLDGKSAAEGRYRTLLEVSSTIAAQPKVRLC